MQLKEYLGINLIKEVKYLYYENYQTLVKEIEDGAKKYLDILCSGIVRINIVKLSYYSKESTDLMQCLSNYQWHFSQDEKK